MILRKPYAFLIKHFKMIHIILSIFMAYLLYKSYNAYSFFNNYLIEAKFNIIENLSSKYITIFMYITIFIIIGITLTVLLLMNFKKKPIKYYLISLITYFLLIFVFIFTTYELKQLEWNEINIQLIKINRDILLVSFLVQIPFLIFTLMRATGFNIKKFNFEKDLKELSVDDIDNEEFEVGLQIDSDDFKTSFRRRIRIARYVIKENKYILLALVAVVMITIGTMLYIQDEVYNKIYEENEALNTSNFQIKILNSYQLNTNTSKNDISSNEYSFSVIKLSFTNKTNKDLSIALDNFRIRTEEFTTYKPDIDNYNNFIEFGTGYKEEQIPAKQTKEYILVFKINKDEQNNDKTLEYLTGGKRKNGELILNYAKFSLNSKTLSKEENLITTNLGQKINLNKSLLKNSSVTVKSVEFSNNFVDKTKKCINNKCYDLNTYIVPKTTSRYKKIVMKVAYDLSLDKSINNKDVSDNFIAKFANLRYVINNQEYNHGISLVDITPSGISGYSYLEVKEEVNKASKVFLDISIRDKVYTYIVK